MNEQQLNQYQYRFSELTRLSQEFWIKLDRTANYIIYTRARNGKERELTTNDLFSGMSSSLRWLKETRKEK